MGSPRPWRGEGGRHGPRLGRFSVPPAAPAPKARPTGVCLVQSCFSHPHACRVDALHRGEGTAACLHSLCAVTQSPSVRNANDRARYRR